MSSFLGLLACRLGFHRKVHFIRPHEDKPVQWVTIGAAYREKCSRCGATTEIRILTKNMLP